MPLHVIRTFRIVDGQFVPSGTITIDDSNGFNDGVFDDGVGGSQPAPFIQGDMSDVSDQNIVATTNSDFSVGDTVRIRSRFSIRNNSTGQTSEILSLDTGEPNANNETNYVLSPLSADWVTTANSVTRMGNALSGNFSIAYDDIPICLTRGTLIKTQKGDLPIEVLTAGDLVLTLDDGYQPLRWIGSRKYPAAQLENNPKLRPIRISAGALAPNQPAQDLLVSPNHRVLVHRESRNGPEQVLIPAKKLVTVPGVAVHSKLEEVEYFHMLFDLHQIIWSNGALTESLLTGREALKALSSQARQEIAAIYPSIMDATFRPDPARRIVEKERQIQSLLCESSEIGAATAAMLQV